MRKLKDFLSHFRDPAYLQQLQDQASDMPESAPRDRFFNRLGVVCFWGVCCAIILFLLLLHRGESDVPPAEIQADFTQTPAEEVQSSLENIIPKELLNLEKKCQEGEIILHNFTMRKQEKFADLLVRAKVPQQKRTEILAILENLKDVPQIEQGQTVYVFTDKEDNFLGIVSYQNDKTVGIVAQEDGSCLPVQHTLPIQPKMLRVKGKIERTFSGSVKKAGLPPELARELMNALGGEIDFYSVHPGDTFDILYRAQETPTGLIVGDKELLFIALQFGNKKIYRYAYQHGKTISFFSPKGEKGEQVLLKRPVSGKTRISSPYGSRRHPILLYTIFHHGVDLAAKMNTPVMAAGDGVITKIGRFGGYGKYIKIRHKDGYETAYGHLNGYKKGLKVGSTVKQSQVIGYVGSTGRSTGPHLHFEVLKNKKTVQPLANHTLSGTQLTGKELEAFQDQAKQINPDFMKHLIGKIPPLPRFRSKV